MNDFGKLVDSSTVRLKRLLPGPIERVWDYLTKPEFLATWLARGYIDACAGGRVELRTIGGLVQGEITLYDPPRTLEYTWVSLPNPVPAGTPDSVVRFELEACGEDVLLTLTHRHLISEYLGRVGAGWHSLLEMLLSRLRGEEPEPFFDIFNRMRPAYENGPALSGPLSLEIPMRIAVVFLLAIASANAQHGHAPPAGEKAVTLLPGLGTWKHPISTTSAEAQKFFDQGLTLMYGFNRYEALRSFRKAVELDPHAAMAYWGIAMVTGPYINIDMEGQLRMKESCDAVEAGLRVSDLKAVERGWLEVALTRCPRYDPGAYIIAMRTFASQYPDDPDAQTLYAEALLLPVRWQWYDIHGNAAAGVTEAEHVLEGVMRRFPVHPGANHLYIHAVESSPTPERAVASAQRLMGTVPAAGHIVHMPAHIWLVLGDYEMAAAVNERAAEVDRQYFARTGVSGGYFMYYMHNLHFIVYARAVQGRWKATSAAVSRMTEAGKTIAEAMPEMAAIFDVVATQTLLRMYRWDDVLAAEPPKADNPVAQAFYHHARALAWEGKGHVGEARTEQAAFEKERAKVDRNMPFGNNKAGPIFDLAAATLDARIAPSAGESVAKWKQAVAIQEQLVYDEPPGWYYPVRESLGAALLLAGDAAGAEQVFREGLRRSPNNGRMLFGLLESLKRQGKSESAYWVQREFERAWSGADIALKLEEL